VRIFTHEFTIFLTYESLVNSLTHEKIAYAKFTHKTGVRTLVNSTPGPGSGRCSSNAAGRLLSPMHGRLSAASSDARLQIES